MFFEKKELTFYEKPGCMGNKKQKELLLSHGITLDVKSILDEPWTKERLLEFFTGLENNQIINQFAPQIKKGQVHINSLDKEALIGLMLKDPILIKRPLMVANNVKICGFDIDKLNSLLQVDLHTEKKLDTCQSSDTCI